MYAVKVHDDYFIEDPLEHLSEVQLQSAMSLFRRTYDDDDDEHGSKRRNQRTYTTEYLEKLYNQ